MHQKTKAPSSAALAGRNTKEAAAYLGVSSSWLDKLRCVGGGPKYLKLGRRVLYRDADLDEWRSQYLVSSTADAEVRQKPAFPALA
jgi:predicted DNA-binding transcriptional regulator AlpA